MLWEILEKGLLTISLDIQKVCGFVVCGPNCKDVNNDKVVVSLLVLLAPEKYIGAPFKLCEYRQELQVDNPHLFDTLGNFVQCDWRSQQDFREIPSNLCYPGCMMIPSSILFEPARVWKVVPSGTAALVIHLTLKDKEESALKFVDKFHTEEKCSLTDFVEKALEAETEAIYIKMTTYATGARWNEAHRLKGVAYNFLCLSDQSKVKVKTWTKAYPAFGKFVLSSKSSVIVLMNDMGCQLTQSKPKTHSEFCLEYLSMMEETINVQKLLRLVHGDIHQGNFVYEEAAPAGLCKLRLIDWDEASNRRPMKRNVVTKVQKERFPDNLLKDAEAYTNTQLFLLFRDISKELYNMNVHMDDTGIVKCSNEQCADGKKSSVTQTTAGEAKQRYESLKAFLTKKQKEAMSS